MLSRPPITVVASFIAVVCSGIASLKCRTRSTSANEVQPWEPGGQAYGDVRFMAVGEVPATEADADPYPGRSLGWYQSWDGESVEFMGFAWHESVDSLDDPQVSGWTPGERYVLDPVYAWEL